MRYIFCLSLSLVLVAVAGVSGASAENGLVYNSTGGKNTNVFNSNKGATSGPIMLKSMISGATANTRRSVRSTASAKPYSFSTKSNGSALSVSPAQVRARQKIEAARSAEYTQRQSQYDVSERAQQIAKERREQRASQYSSRFNTSQNVGGEEQRTAPVRTVKKPVFLKSGGFEIPSKVFGSNY